MSNNLTNLLKQRQDEISMESGYNTKEWLVIDSLVKLVTK